MLGLVTNPVAFVPVSVAVPTASGESADHVLELGVLARLVVSTAAHVHVIEPSVTVPPIVVGHVGSYEPEKPAVATYWKPVAVRGRIFEFAE